MGTFWTVTANASKRCENKEDPQGRAEQSRDTRHRQGIGVTLFSVTVVTLLVNTGRTLFASIRPFCRIARSLTTSFPSAHLLQLPQDLTWHSLKCACDTRSVLIGVLASLCGLNSLIRSRLLTLDHLLLRLHCVVTYSPQYTYWSIIIGRLFYC